MKWLNSFTMNNIYWRVALVPSSSNELIDRTGTLTVATTDPLEHVVYIDETLDQEFMTHVFIHELGHVAMISFNLLTDIRRMVLPQHWVEMEEWVCNLIADHGQTIYRVAYQVLGGSALSVVPREIERFVA